MAKGQVAIYLLMLAVVVVILALSLAPAIKEAADNARAAPTDNNEGLDCTNESISDYQKAQCMVVDATLPYWFFVMLGIAGAILAARLYFGGSQ